MSNYEPPCLIAPRRYLLKSAYAAQNGDTLAASVAYLAEDTSGQTWPAKTEKDVTDSGLLSRAYQHRAYR